MTQAQGSSDGAPLRFGTPCGPSVELDPVSSVGREDVGPGPPLVEEGFASEGPG